MVNPRSVLLILITIVSAVIIFYFINVTLFCQGDQPLDFKFFNISCESIPNQPKQLDEVFKATCNNFIVNYSCDTNYLNVVKGTYSEFNKPARDYTLAELCRLKNPYYVDMFCARLCGCNT